MLSHTVQFQTIDISLLATSLSNLPGNGKAGQVEKGKYFQPIREKLNKEQNRGSLTNMNLLDWYTDACQ